MAVGMAVATMGRDDAAAGEECAGSDELPDEAWREINGGGGIPGAEELYVQRPAGTGNPQGQAWRGGRVVSLWYHQRLQRSFNLYVDHRRRGRVVDSPRVGCCYDGKRLIFGGPDDGVAFGINRCA